MKLSNVFAKLTCIKVNAVRVLATAAVAGAVFAAAAPAAEAQHFAVGVRIGGPVVVAPRPIYERGPVFVEPRAYGHEFYGRDFYERRRFEEHEAFIRHEEWEHAHYARHYGYR